MIYKNLIRPVLFNFDPETISKIVLESIDLRITQNILKRLTSTHLYKNYTVFGIDFPNRIGLAAGFDKNAAHVDGFSAMGFGFIEIGTVTPKAQPGNPKPRLFRLVPDSAIINRMGFNNEGVNAAVSNLSKKKSNIIIGGNIGKNKITPNDRAIDDYLTCFNILFDSVDYFVVNVSSPNTPNLRELQDKKPLMEILNRIQEENNRKIKRKPVLLKIAPDLTEEQINDIIEIVKITATDGIVATNTTITRNGLNTPDEIVNQKGEGGLSGKPLFKRSTEIIRFIKKKSDIPVIGVGGIMSPEDALEKVKAGADLIQIYTGLIFEGPLLVKRINDYLAANLN